MSDNDFHDYPYEYMNSFKRFGEEKLPDRKCFYISVKDRTTGDNGEKLHCHVRDENYLTCNKIWNEFNIKNMGDYHNHYWHMVKILQTRSLPLF